MDVVDREKLSDRHGAKGSNLQEIGSEDLERLTDPDSQSGTSHCCFCKTSLKQTEDTWELDDALFYPCRFATPNSATWEENLLIEDTYYPGLIDDGVNKYRNFNDISFDLFFQSFEPIPRQSPQNGPISLLEAFYKRIAYEREKLLEATKSKNNKKPELTVKSVDTYFLRKPETSLNKALSDLYKAEALYGGKGQKGKENEKTPYTMSIQRRVEPIDGLPISVEIFIGTTKPKNFWNNVGSKLRKPFQRKGNKSHS